jgi:peptidylprolyl isomerase
MATFTFTRASLLPVLFAGALSAQTAAPAHHTATTTAHRATTAATGPAACAKDIPVLSLKIPAVPAGSACARPLYTISSTPAVKLDYVSPLEGPGLRETLGLEGSSFSLSYIDTKIGTGELAQPHKFYTIHYTGYLTDGTKFDSSVDRNEPIVIPYGGHQVIPGWDTGFDGMRVGGKRRLFIPFQLAYGATAHGPIPARSELVFDVEFVAQSDTKPEPKTPPAPAAAPAAVKPATPAATPKPVPAATPDATPKPTAPKQ